MTSVLYKANVLTTEYLSVNCKFKKSIDSFFKTKSAIENS
jgi:hypothetical protein